MDSPRLWAPLESFDEVVQRPATVSKPLTTQFPHFSSLPPELRLEIWNWVLEREKGDRQIQASCEGVKPPTSLLSPLFAVNVESRAEALRWYPHVLPVYRYDWRPCAGRESPWAGVVHFDCFKDAVWLEGVRVFGHRILGGLFVPSVPSSREELQKFTRELAEPPQAEALALWIWVTWSEVFNRRDYSTFTFLVKR